MTTLFESLTLGNVRLRNRIVMAPMTRSRADEQGRIGPLTAQYYGQRASAGLIVSEGIYPSPMGKGYVRTPGLASDEHVRAWQAVTDAVHQNGGRIFAQIMHVGRISHPTLLPGGSTPVAPSAVRPTGAAYTTSGLQPFVTPRALDRDEIDVTLAEYGVATRRALAAGFDGVELHAASGYLPEQFLSSGTNLRTDEYGGSLRNRARFVLDALAVMIAVDGAHRVGMKIAPELGFNDIVDDTPHETYEHLVDAVAPLGLAYLHVATKPELRHYHARLRPRFPGAYLAGGGFGRADAEALLASDSADAVVFGEAFIANPDLPERLRRNVPLAHADRSTFYSPGAAGYVDYPRWDAQPTRATG